MRWRQLTSAASLPTTSRTFADSSACSAGALPSNVRNGTEHLDSLTHNTDELVQESRQTINRVNDSVAQAA